VPFAQEDLVRVFEPGTVRQGRALILAGFIGAIIVEGRIEASVAEPGRELWVSITPMRRACRIQFDRVCSCDACAHMAAAAMLVLNTRSEWRRPGQTSLLDLLDPAPVTATPGPGRSYSAAWPAAATGRA
jgi:hypothetical protein